MSEKECYFSGNVGTENDRKGVFWLFDNAKQANGGWLAVNVIEGLENLSYHEGLEPLREVTTGRTKRNKILIHGIPITIVTEKSIPSDGNNKPLAAIEPTKDFLDNLDMIPNIPKIFLWEPMRLTIGHYVTTQKALPRVL